MTSEQYNRAKLFLQTKKFGQGLKYIKALLTESPEDDVLYAFLAGNFQGLRKFDEAEKAISKAISLNPSEYSHYKIATRIMILMKNPEGAKKFLDTALKLNPNDPDLFGYHSAIRITWHEFDMALHIANDGLKIDPENVQCLRSKGLALSFLKRHIEAQEITDQLLGENPINAQNLLAGGLVTLNSGSGVSADMIALSLEREPNNPHIQSAYRLALRNELPGFRQIKNRIYNVSQQGTIEATIVGLGYGIFFILCIGALACELLGFEIPIQWLMFYLLFWNVNLIYQWVISVPFPLYDAWLFIDHSKSRVFYSFPLKLKILTTLTLMLFSLGLFVHSISFFSIYSYQIALHVATLVPLTFYILHYRYKNAYWTFGYFGFVILMGILSLLSFDEDMLYFFVFNIIFRVLSVGYTRLRLNKIH